jgi:hypothetical protein
VSGIDEVQALGFKRIRLRAGQKNEPAIPQQVRKAAYPRPHFGRVGMDGGEDAGERFEAVDELKDTAALLFEMSEGYQPLSFRFNPLPDELLLNGEAMSYP